MENPPTITSFVIRFVFDSPGPPAEQQADGQAYRGTIRHIQSNQEISFTRWSDVVDFVQRFVPIAAESSIDRDLLDHPSGEPADHPKTSL